MKFKSILIVLFSWICACHSYPMLDFLNNPTQKQLDAFKRKKGTIQTPSDGHLFANGDTVLNTFKSDALSDTDLTDCLKRAYTKECAETKKGRYVFFHAQRWQWEWYAKIYKLLYEATTKAVAQPYQFLRFFNPQKIDVKKEEQIRIDSLKIGRINSWNNGKCLRPRLFFLNASLFGNTSFSGCCTVDLLQRNYDWSRSGINYTEKIFKKFKANNLYKKYLKRLTALEAEHATLSNHGNLLLFSLSKPYVQKNMYMGSPSGYKNTVDIHGKTTDNIRLFMDTLKKDPSAISETDHIEFVLILTKHITLQPSPDCHIFSFNTVDPKKQAAFNKKCIALFNQIKKDLT